MATFNRDELREMFRKVYYLKTHTRLARGELSRLIRDAARQESLASQGLLAYAEENRGLGDIENEEEKAFFERAKGELLGRIGNQLVEMGDESWVARFDG